MTRTKSLLLIFALSFFAMNLSLSVYFFNKKDIFSLFGIVKKINYFEEIKINFPDIENLIVTDISLSSFAVKGVIKNNYIIYNVIDYFKENKVDIKTLVIEPAQSSHRAMNIKLVLKQ